MPRGKGVRIKKTLPKGTTQEDVDNLNGMFDQLTGVKDADPEIIIPKFVELKNMIRRLYKVYCVLMEFKEFQKIFPEYQPQLKQTSEFFIKLMDTYNIYEKTVETEDKFEDMSGEEVNKMYVALKDSEEVKSLIVASANLNHFKKDLYDEKDLKDTFIKKEPGVSFTPIPFCKLDLKRIWASDSGSAFVKKFLLTILHKTYTIGFSIYDNITSPNIDIKKFSNVLVESIKTIRKQVPRCDKAFDMIAESVSMLENNFKGYYKTSVEASNPSLIIESFIVDVSMKQKTNATITTQFRRIVMFMKKKSQGNNDPRVKKLFGILNSQFKTMESNTPGYTREEEPDKTPADDEVKL